MAEKKAVIDIGTNSIKFCLAEAGGKSNYGYTILQDANDIVRLGEGLKDTQRIGEEALERNAQSVANFARIAKEAGADEIAVVGTMALRIAKNTADFQARVWELAGLEVRVIPGEEEAQLSYLAVVKGIEGASGSKLMTMDTGGGSTEFIFGNAGKLERKFSLNIGAVRFTEQYLSEMPVSPEHLEAADKAIHDELVQGGVEGPVPFLVGMGGTVTSMAAVKHKMVTYDPDVIQGSSLTEADVASQIADYAAKTLDGRKAIAGLQPKRADVILAGALIVKNVLKITGATQLIVSDRGLRHGLLYELFHK